MLNAEVYTTVWLTTAMLTNVTDSISFKLLLGFNIFLIKKNKMQQRRSKCCRANSYKLELSPVRGKMD